MYYNVILFEFLTNTGNQSVKTGIVESFLNNNINCEFYRTKITNIDHGNISKAQH